MTDEYLMPFGKHKGKPIGEVPADYLLWIAEQPWSGKWKEVEEYINLKFDQLKAEVEQKDE